LARKELAKKIVVAVPVAPPQVAAALRALADEFVCLLEPKNFSAIGQFYKNFEQVEDDEARRLLKEGSHV
jgi:predicted phosphoribosyltransferase